MASPASARTTPDPPRVSLIIPVYNSKELLPFLFEQVVPFATDRDFEIVFVDDASSDGSLDLLRSLERSASNIVVVSHNINRGQGEASLTGIHAARHDIVVLLDDDLQHQPTDIPILLARLAESGPETLVMGVGKSWRKPYWRLLASRCANILSNLFLPKPLPVELTSFCAFHRSLCERIRADGSFEIALVAALVQAATQTLVVPVELDSARQNYSRYELGTLWRMFLRRLPLYKLGRVFLWFVFSTFGAISCGYLVVGQIAPLSIRLGAIGTVFASASLVLAILAFQVGRLSQGGQTAHSRRK